MGEQQHVEEVAGQQQCGDPATVPELDASATSQSKRRGRPPKSAISNTPAPESG